MRNFRRSNAVSLYRRSWGLLKQDKIPLPRPLLLFLIKQILFRVISTGYYLHCTLTYALENDIKHILIV